MRAENDLMFGKTEPSWRSTTFLAHPAAPLHELIDQNPLFPLLDGLLQGDSAHINKQNRPQAASCSRGGAYSISSPLVIMCRIL
jgi:hypothetical protein